MVCALRYAIAIIHNNSGEPLTKSKIDWVVRFHNDNQKYDIMLDSIDTIETKYGTVVTAEVDNRDGSMEHSTTPIKSVVITLMEGDGNATFMY